jgi:hypothetical protein
MKKNSPLVVFMFLILLGAMGSHAAEPKFEVQLKRAWVTSFMDRTSIAAAMVVHHSHDHPNNVGAKSDDGDLHFSGESDDVGLPFVAEIVNAAAEMPVVDFVKETAGANEEHPAAQKPVQVTGAWRLWFEHPSQNQIQGSENLFYPDNTNPNHSFEIHPVSEISGSPRNTFDVSDKIVPVENFATRKLFDAYRAETAFPYYEGVTVAIKASNSGIAIRSPQLKYNYVKFDAELTHKPKRVADGYIALAAVQGEGADEEGLPGEIRLIFIEGSKGATAMALAKRGDSLSLLGVPRVNLNALMALVDQNGTTEFKAKLPYEMIVIGIYPH